MAVRGSWGLAKMPVNLSTLVRTRKQDGATALEGIQSQLAEDEDLAPNLEDVAPGMAAHIKCTHFQFGHLLDMHAIDYSLTAIVKL